MHSQHSPPIPDSRYILPEELPSGHFLRIVGEISGSPPQICFCALKTPRGTRSSTAISHCPKRTCPAAQAHALRIRPGAGSFLRAQAAPPPPPLRLSLRAVPFIARRKAASTCNHQTYSVSLYFDSDLLKQETRWPPCN